MTSTTSPSISTVSGADNEQAVATIVTAFTADPALRWVLPDPQQYLTYAAEFVRRFCGEAFESQSAYAAESFMGAALWLRPGSEPDGESLGELMQDAIPEEDQQKVSEFLDQMDVYHPQEPVWYLAMIGVDPTGQGMGLGSALDIPTADLDRTAHLSIRRAAAELGIPRSVLHRARLSRRPVGIAVKKGQ